MTIGMQVPARHVSHLIGHLSTNGKVSFMGLGSNLISGMTGGMWDWVCAHLGPHPVTSELEARVFLSGLAKTPCWVSHERVYQRSFNATVLVTTSVPLKGAEWLSIFPRDICIPVSTSTWPGPHLPAREWHTSSCPVSWLAILTPTATTITNYYYVYDCFYYHFVLSAQNIWHKFQSGFQSIPLKQLFPDSPVT